MGRRGARQDPLRWCLRAAGVAVAWVAGLKDGGAVMWVLFGSPRSEPRRVSRRRGKAVGKTIDGGALNRRTRWMEMQVSH